MHHADPLTSIAFIAVMATVCGMVLVWRRQPAVVGFIFAGILLGPGGFGLVENRDSIALLAELGVILLLYVLGMELSLRSIGAVWRVALCATLAQIGVSVLAVLGVGKVLGWPMEYVVLFGFCLALSSTAVAVKILDNMGALQTRTGHLTVAILIAQDLAVAPMLVIISNLNGSQGVLTALVEVSVSVALLTGIVLYLARRRNPVNLPFHRLLTRHSDLAALGALTWCFALSAASGLLGLSPAFGAFLAGLVAGNSAQADRVRHHIEPVQSILLMVFFLSIGLLVDPAFVLDNLGLILLAWSFVTVFKTVLNAGLLRLLGESWRDALMVALVIGQMGEFAFVMVGAARGDSLINDSLYHLVVAITILTLITSPFYIDAARRLSENHHVVLRGVHGVRGALRLLYRREWTTLRLLRRAFRRHKPGGRGPGRQRPEPRGAEHPGPARIGLGRDAPPGGKDAPEPGDPPDGKG